MSRGGGPGLVATFAKVRWVATGNRAFLVVATWLWNKLSRDAPLVPTCIVLSHVFAFAPGSCC